MSFVVGGPVGDSELLLCHGMVCVVGRMRDLILQLSKSSIYSTKFCGDKKTRPGARVFIELNMLQARSEGSC
jgi:hypothetical protein